MKVLKVQVKTIIKINILFINILIVITYESYSIGLWRIILYVVTPIMLLKQIISLIHLYIATLDMASIDEIEREGKNRTN